MEFALQEGRTAMSALLPSSEDGVPLNLYRVSSPGVARVLANYRLTPPGAADVRHVVLDLSRLEYRYREGQSLGVLPPGVNEHGRPHKLRLYSIASARAGDDGRGTSASLCVKRVLDHDPVTGAEHRGIASNYLCDLKPGDEVRVTGPAGKLFLLPDDPGTNLILVATGTGIAPFRAFLRRIYGELPGWSGRVWLFFGVRTRGECLYREEFESYLDRPGYRQVFAFSREQQTSEGARMYVHHRMDERRDALGPLFERERTMLYVCGLKGMETGIEALFGVPPQGGVPWPSFAELRKKGQVLIETY
jgi:ferredoxin--NADP+ reductase